MPLGVGYDLSGAQRVAQQNPVQRGPGRLAQLLAAPGVRDMLLSVGSSLMQQSRSPGSIGSALGQALPQGVQALRAGQMDAQLDEALADAPESMKRLLSALPPGLKAQAALGLLARGEADDPVTLAPGAQLVQPETGEVIAENPAADSYQYRNMPDGTVGVFAEGELINTFGEPPAPEGADFSDTNALADDFEAKIKPFDQVAEAYNKVRVAGEKEDPTAADDVSLVFGYMKIVDPGSTVREGEQATARNAAGIPDRLRAIYNNAVAGETLAPAQRANFVQAARELVQSQVPLFEARADHYRGIATRNGIDPADVIRNPFAGTDIGTLEDPLGIR